MIGSPDLLAFSGAEGFMEGSEEDLESQCLPEELSVPLFAPENPWSSTAQFNRDFILVAEFSEQVGPSPVLTIPDDSRVIGSFDLNHFSVRIMSVDYQASGPGPVLPSSLGPRLNFSEDSRVVLGDSAEDAFAYVHHVTLYDLEARGMVRPFCMAYVCSDQTKLMENFTELSTCFSKASDSLKTGNRQAFSMELQRKLQDLEFRRLSLKQESYLSSSNSVTDDPSELESIEHSILTHRELLRQVTSYPNRKLKQPDFLPYDPAPDSLPDLSSYLPSEPLPSSLPRSEHQLKPLHELCNAYFLSLMKEQLVDTERCLRGDRSILRTSAVINSLSKGLTLTNFLFELWATDEGEEEEEKTSTGTGVNEAQMGTEEAEPLCMESFLSCVEEIPIKMEAERRAAVSPEPAVSTEMTGSVSSNDSIEVLGIEKSFRMQQVITQGDVKETPGLMVEPSFRHAPADAGVKHMRVYARRANSEDSIEVLSTTNSICPEDLSAITEVNEHEPLTNEFNYNTSETPVSNGFNHHSSKTPMNEVPVKQNHTPAPQPSVQVKANSHSLKSSHVQDNRGTHQQGQDVMDSGGWSSLSLVQSLHVNPVSAVSRWSQSSAPVRLLSVDESSDCTSATGSWDPPSPDHSIKKKRRRRKAGLRALRFLKHNSFSQHALYCLLSGRPLVVMGADDSFVRKTVDGLSLFLPSPGPEGGSVMPSLTSPLQLSDLLIWRLIGFHRLSSSCSSAVVHSLSRYSRYLSVLDLDQRTLRAPSYSGSLIGGLAEPQCSFSRGLTYLLHLESGLTALQNKALLYMFCPHVKHRPLQTQKDMSECDHRVLCFLSDLIGQNHTGRGPPVLTFSYNSVQLHRNTTD